VSTRSAADLYEDDFYAWTQLQAKELRRFARTRPNLPLDLPHIAEEIADLGKNLRDSMRSWTRHLIEPLLLLQYSPAQEPRRGWTAEIVNLRSEIEDRLTPRLHRDLERRLPRLYDRARRDLRKKLAPYGEAHIADRIPETCPYTFDQILDEDWWPVWAEESAGGEQP
jgi:Domain of unknown function DUF29